MKKALTIEIKTNMLDFRFNNFCSSEDTTKEDDLSTDYSESHFLKQETLG